MQLNPDQFTYYINYITVQFSPIISSFPPQNDCITCHREEGNIDSRFIFPPFFSLVVNSHFYGNESLKNVSYIRPTNVDVYFTSSLLLNEIHFCCNSE